MNPSPCQSLADYLARDLGEPDRARFEAHLADCPDCRRAVGEAQRLQGLLAAAVSELEPVPGGLVERVGRRLRRARRRRIAAVVGALAPAAAVLWLVSRTAPPRVEPEPPPPGADGQPDPPAPGGAAVEPAAQVRVTFPADANVVVVRAETES